MKSISIRTVVASICILLCGNVLAADISYNFNGSLKDSDNTHPGINYVFTDRGVIINALGSYQDYINTSPAYGTDGSRQYVELAWDDFIGFDPSFLTELDLDQPTRIAVEFKFHPDDPLTNTSPCCTDSLFRHVITTKSNYQAELGFLLQIKREEDESYALNLFVGDGSGYLVNGFEGGTEGYWFQLGEVSPDEWITVDLTFRLDEPGKERIIALANGGLHTFYLTDPEHLRPAALKRHLEGELIGQPPDYDPYQDMCETWGCNESGLDIGQVLGVKAPGLFVGGYPTMDPHNATINLLVDSLVVQSPAQPGDPDQINTLLDGFTQDLTGQSPQDEAVLREWLATITGGLDGNWDETRDKVIAYLDAFSDTGTVLFPDEFLRDPGDFDATSSLAYFLEQWILDNRFQGSLDSADSGIKFSDSEVFPGPVNPVAPRVSGMVEIDGNYHTDPGFTLNGQENVIRPTGYYAAPGEPVTITVPASAVTENLKVRVGIHRADMESGLWSEFNRFPRISSLYDVTATTITVANPFGGGIYFEVADGSDLGIVPVEIDGAVKMPMFSTLDLAGHSDDAAQFAADIENWYTPWFELHSRNFSATLYANEGRLYPDPAAVLAIMDAGFDEIRMMAGRPPAGIRSEWLAYDRVAIVAGTAIAASYPIFPGAEIGASGEFWDRPQVDTSPALYLSEDFFAPDDPADDLDNYDQRESNFILFHEWGHLHNLPTLKYQESESNVHLLATVFYNRVLGADIDTALQWSGFQHFNREQAAQDVMFSPNWQEGKRLNAGEQIYGIWDNELRYQTRSWARLVEIAALYGWEAVGEIHKAFYERGVAANKAVNYDLEDDDFIETASAALNLNLSPLFDFWGVPPSAAAAERLKQYPVPAEFKDRLLRYRAIAPRTKADFQAIYDTHALTNGGEVMIRMDYYLEHFDDAMSQTILSRIDGILSEYYGIESIDDNNEVTGVTPPDESIPVAVKTNTIGTGTRSADISLGIYADNGKRAYDTAFSAGDFVTLYGRIEPDPQDVGKNGELYAALVSIIDGKVNISYINEDGTFIAWDTSLDTLEPALVATPLESSHELRFFEGKLQAGTYRFTIAYKAEDGPLVYMKPVKIVVTN